VKYFFEPRSITVIGASRNPDKVGHTLVNNLSLFNYNGRIYPVNPAGGTIKGLKVYETVREIPDSVDLAIIAIPAGGVPVSLRECIRTRLSWYHIIYC
jgi:acetyl-CoA synthetase (ADP-forming)